MIEFLRRFRMVRNGEGNTGDSRLVTKESRLNDVTRMVKVHTRRTWETI